MVGPFRINLEKCSRTADAFSWGLLLGWVQSQKQFPPLALMFAVCFLGNISTSGLKGVVKQEETEQTVFRDQHWFLALNTACLPSTSCLENGDTVHAPPERF